MILDSMSTNKRVFEPHAKCKPRLFGVDLACILVDSISELVLFRYLPEANYISLSLSVCLSVCLSMSLSLCLSLSLSLSSPKQVYRERACVSAGRSNPV